MPGTYAKPKAYNRIWWIDVRAAEQPEWAKIAVGISSRGNSINEQSQDYYDMEGRGVAESEVTSVAVTRTFTGWRAIGDKAQDAVMENTQRSGVERPCCIAKRRKKHRRGNS